jgi:hypothetical protein
VLLYSSYLGGSDDDEARGIAVDADGNILLAGVTRSIDFPVAAAIQGVNVANSDAFVTKLSADGRTLLYSTYLGGSGFDDADAIAVDGAGNAYITGGTSSVAFPVTAGAFQTLINGNNDAFVTKLDPQGRIVYSTFLGGLDNPQSIFVQEEGRGIAVDRTGKVYVTSITSSLAFPVTATGFQLSGGSGAGPRTSIDNYDAFLTVLNAQGTALIYSTYIAGNGIDYGHGKCTGAATATCDIGTLAKGATATVKIVRKPTIAGGVSHAVAVRGAVHDSNTANDGAVVVTAVAP